MAPEEDVVLEAGGPVAVVTLNRPASGNSLTASLLEALTRTLDELAEGGEARCVVLKGAGEKFSVGMDLNAMAGCTPEESQKLIGAGGPLRRAMSAIEAFPFPVIAVIRGHAAGAACELASSCDLRAGAESCRMGMPPARLGMVYPPEGIQRFARTFGPAVARKLFYTARYFEGPELFSMGMLDFLYPDGELDSSARALAEQVAANAPLSMKGHKRCLSLLAGPGPLPPEVSQEISALTVESLGSADALEGISAFVEKRAPDFTGQ